MQIEFIADDPRTKARSRLDQLLRNGVDQLAIACAFCTAAGVDLLRRHAIRLSKPSSFVVISAMPPTNYAELSKLHRLISNNLFIHWGSLAPNEIKNGAALMHSKVFLARAGEECWLWTGSHNLTGQATQGGNCEAAILLNGSADEQPFRDALNHLVACRNEATPYDPDTPAPNSVEAADLLVIHAEADPLPTTPFPWHIHLCLDSADFDGLLYTPANIRLLLYSKGLLHRGWQQASPSAAYSGSLTGLNLTARNRNARGAGVPAEWSAAQFNIFESGGVLVFGPAQPPGNFVATQAVLNIETAANPEESLFSEEPRIKNVPTLGQERRTEVDGDMKQHFRKKDVIGSSLLHVPVTGRRRVISVVEDELRPDDFEKVRLEMGAALDIVIEPRELSSAKQERRHPYIVRTKYRLGRKG